MLKKLGILGAASIFAAVALIGCTPESKNSYTAAGHNLAQAAKETGQGLQSDVRKAGDDMDNDATSAKVQEGLVSDKNVDISDLKVNTEGRTVTLQGTVHSPGEKSRSTDIARNRAGSGFIIVNQLRVAG